MYSAMTAVAPAPVDPRQMEPTEEEDDDDDDDVRGAPDACCACVAVLALLVAYNCGLVMVGSIGGAEPNWMPKETGPEMTVEDVTSSTKFSWTSFYSLSLQIGLNRQLIMTALIFNAVSFICIIGSAATAAYVVTCNPQLAPSDFENRGTLSNVCQDITTPRGRLFTVAMYTAGILQMISTYTVSNYRPWQPEVSSHPNIPEGLRSFVFEGLWERCLRNAWTIIPNCGFMFTAAIPSLSEKSGTQWALYLVHNVMAPLSMLYLVFMETYQLNHGENAFEYFFSTEPTPIYGPLTGYQRMRVYTIVWAWGCGFVFISIQVYLNLGLVGVQCRQSYTLAEISFYAEVLSTSFAFFNPVLAGLEQLWNEETMDIVSKTMGVVMTIKRETGEL